MAEPDLDQSALSELYCEMWRCMVEKDMAGLVVVRDNKIFKSIRNLINYKTISSYSTLFLSKRSDEKGSGTCHSKSLKPRMRFTR